ncbi:cyclic nucleotide-binding domain-containing protein [Streptomyces sp. NPDC033753]|uniref:cyclic nucleotide-binding domain-containing protein n=1 Tax=Streptomyces sp. NPDC033753 TaxID=3155128 RepID=UPI0033DA7E55
MTTGRSRRRPRGTKRGHPALPLPVVCSRDRMRTPVRRSPMSSLASPRLTTALSADQRDRLMTCGRPVDLPEGTRMFEEADPAQRFWILRTGTVTSDFAVPGTQPAVIDTVNAGELLGWYRVTDMYTWAEGTNQVTQPGNESLIGGAGTVPTARPPADQQPAGQLLAEEARLLPGPGKEAPDPGFTQQAPLPRPLPRRKPVAKTSHDNVHGLARTDVSGPPPWARDGEQTLPTHGTRGAGGRFSRRPRTRASTGPGTSGPGRCSRRSCGRTRHARDGSAA